MFCKLATMAILATVSLQYLAAADDICDDVSSPSGPRHFVCYFPSCTDPKMDCDPPSIDVKSLTAIPLKALMKKSDRCEAAGMKKDCWEVSLKLRVTFSASDATGIRGLGFVAGQEVDGKTRTRTFWSHDKENEAEPSVPIVPTDLGSGLEPTDPKMVVVDVNQPNNNLPAKFPSPPAPVVDKEEVKVNAPAVDRGKTIMIQMTKWISAFVPAGHRLDVRVTELCAIDTLEHNRCIPIEKLK